MTTKQFRILLSVYIFSTLFGALFDTIFPSALPETITQAQRALDANMSGLLLIVIVIFGLVILVGAIASIVGLFIFKPWAPKIALITTALALCVWPLIGVNVVSGWSASLTELSNTLWGVILTMVYFTPLKEKFKVVC